MVYLEKISSEGLSNKQRQLGNTCYFLYSRDCVKQDKNKSMCLNGMYNHCTKYQALTIKVSNNSPKEIKQNSIKTKEIKLK